jgi:hypothetical protein
MGGLAIKKVINKEPVRLNVEQYNEVVEHVVEQLTLIKERHGFTGEFRVVPHVRNKESFGDLDVIISMPRDDEMYNDLIMNSGEYKYVKNGPVTSYVHSTCVIDSDGLPQWSLFQVDFIFVSEAGFKTMCNYHGYGDIGNFIGRLANGMGLKYGHTGLSYVYKIDTYVVVEITLSTSLQDILEFFGLSYSKYCAGFDSMEDVYEYIMASPYFHPSMFDLDMRSYEGRVRDQKRPTYNRFIEVMNARAFPEKPLVNKEYFLVALVHFGKMHVYTSHMLFQAERLFHHVVFDNKFIAREANIDLSVPQPQFGLLKEKLKNTVHAPATLDITTARDNVSMNIKLINGFN